MDPIRNPFAPGAGNQPPELAGRREILQAAEIVLARPALGRHAKSFMLVGLRGVGKTVLLVRIEEMARSKGMHVALVESPEDKPLPQLLIPPLRQILLALDRLDSLNEHVKRGLRTLRSFVNAIKLKYGDVELGLDIDPETGTADSGDLERDLADLVVAVGEAAKARKTVVALLIDELQYLSEAHLSALIMAFHRTSQRQLPIVLIGAGLPQLVGNMGRSKSYAERLFDFPNVGPLARNDAVTAIVEPITQEVEKIQMPAVDLIIEKSKGYPYFVQVWGYQAWNSSPKSPIRRIDIEAAEVDVLRSLDESFFRVRFDRLTPGEKKYLRAMAELGPGPHRSGDIAEVLDVKVQSVAPTRSSLIQKGMIYSPAHGDTAFTVPMFDDFLKRQIPGLT